MNKDFKKALIPYLFDGHYLVTYMLQNIPNWPQINLKEFFDDEEEFYEPLDTENCEFVDFTEDTLIISCGGDWQEPQTIVIGFVDNKVQVIDAVPGEYLDGIDYSMFEELFLEAVVGVKSSSQLKYELETAVNDEDYMLAAKLRDELIQRNVNKFANNKT
jgi:hypothetical protein